MSNGRQRIACIVGTRPELIKMAPIIFLLKKNPSYKVTVINTAQHRGMLDDMLKIFAIDPDIDLNVMQENQTLSLLTSRLFEKFEKALAHQYDLILVQGDTTSTLVATEVAFFNHIPVGHVEAGLRSYDFHHPFPEEMNRVFISKLATLHFAPTQIEADILLSERIPQENIFITGNTVIDSLLDFAKRNTPIPITLNDNKRLILVTMHRRESFGEPLRNVFKAFHQLAETFDDIEIVYPVHPNPNVSKMAELELNHHPRIHLIKPVTYDVFVSLMNKAYLIMSDSGGIQEEAPALNKPLIILRDVTERPLIVTMGMAKLVGTNKKEIISVASALLSDHEKYHAMQKNISPYGDGHAAQRILKEINQFILDKQGITCER